MVAAYQLGELSNISKSDFLLRMDQVYCSPEIVEARKIIHEIYCKTYKSKFEDLCPDKRRDVHAKVIGKEILKLSREEKEAGSFIKLLNFLDFLEGVAYFANKNELEAGQLSELRGKSIIFYYKIFKPWIDRHTEAWNEEKYFYCELKKWVEEQNK